MLSSEKHIAALCIGPGGRMELKPYSTAFSQLLYDCKTGLFDMWELDSVKCVAVGR